MNIIIFIVFIINLCVINCHNHNKSFITNEELTRASRLTHEEIAALEDENPIDVFSQEYFQGDIKLPENANVRSNLRYISRSTGLHWPNNEVPYSIDAQLDNRQRQLIASAVEFFNERTCVRLVPKQANSRSWMSIRTNEDGCFSSSFGRSSNGANVINLGNGCFSRETIIHEIMHRIGFIHEQSRPDRDGFVSIFTENMKDRTESQFRVYSELFSREYGLPYDVHSVMHYFETAFSKNGRNTIQAKNGARLGCRNGNMQCPTNLDIQKINRVYNCPGRFNSKLNGLNQNSAVRIAPKPNKRRPNGRQGNEENNFDN